MKFLKALILALLVAMIALPAAAADIELAKKSTISEVLKRGELRVGFDAGYPPFEMTDKNGKYIGFDVDLGKELAKAMGVKFVPVNTDFDGMVPSLLADKFDIIISGMTLTQERNLKIGFSDPYIIMGQTVLVNAKHKGKITSYKQLNDPKFIVISRMGTTGEEATKRYIPKATYKSFEKEVDCALEVINGRADAFVYDLPVNEVFQKQQGKDKTFLLNEPFTFEPMAIGLKQGDPDFLNFLNNFLRQIKNDGRYERMYDKWLRSDEWQSQVK
ncbi:transporter substrate-binding domain-containing protein [Desulfovibrio subterraneus]|jgi:polar amino acid transport system substrate-binding protein|uniref:Amino acid ABC transporter substrate-binding protein n=1 Tax=Desulfovibrio subterraneus TaxID=2718620 RepID=A0A7J0BJQ5_9BACT|nr:transporter substrate-binding domain-containing protein [Desulfovibrio subterraneus]GFM33451.1 amino acid ABC transporter substrate-binding protein [Desulfovibrio subterraneus]